MPTEGELDRKDAERQYEAVDFHRCYERITAESEIMRATVQRKGQFVFNELGKVRPDIANVVAGSLVDPFHNDDKIPEFWDLVIDLW